MTEDIQRSVFHAVVTTQDFLLANTKKYASIRDAVARARGIVAARFGIPMSEVKEIERKGIDGQWAPLAA